MLPVFAVCMDIQACRVNQESAFTLEQEVYVILLLVLFRYEVTLCVDYFHKEYFEFLYHIPAHRSQSRYVSDQKVYFLFTHRQLRLFDDVLIAVTVDVNDKALVSDDPGELMS